MCWLWEWFGRLGLNGWWGVLGALPNHILALLLVGFRGKREKLDPGRPAKRPMQLSVEGCCELDSGSGHWHGGTSPRPLQGWKGSLSISSLAASLDVLLWFRNLTTETLPAPGAALWTQGPAQHEEQWAQLLGSPASRRGTGMPGRSFSLFLLHPLISGMHREPLWFGCETWSTAAKWSQAVCLF